jgi:hypothetical protein
MNAVTNTELDAFYGVEPASYEISSAIRDAVDNLDKDDLSETAWANDIAILAAIKSGDAFELLHIFQVVMKDIAARRASLALYSKIGLITPAHVDLGVGA